jgi:hypothetical protein
MEDYLNFKVSQIRDVQILDIEKIPVINSQGVSLTKVTFHVKDHNDKEYYISDALVSKRGINSIKGLFLTLSGPDEISSGSPLGKLLKYYKKTYLREFINTTVQVYPDKNDYLVLVACIFKEK